MRIKIENARVICPKRKIDAQQDIYIAQGKFAGFEQAPDGFTADITLNAKNAIACPGLIDLSARFGEPGGRYKGTIYSETRAAAKGGITTLVCPPDNDPITDNEAVAYYIKKRAMEAGFVQVLPLGAATFDLNGEQLSDLALLKEAGCIGISQARRPFKNLATLRAVFLYAASNDLIVFFDAQEPSLSMGVIHNGALNARLGLPFVPETAETIAIAQALLLQQETGVRLHINRITCAKSVMMIQTAQQQGLAVTCDVAAHYLYFTDNDLFDFDSNYHLNPVLRSSADQQALLDGLHEGIIQAICSDHEPRNSDDKAAPFAQTKTGIASLETLLPLVLGLRENLNLSLTQVLHFVTDAPAQILGIHAGQLKVGEAADLTIFDPKTVWTVNQDSWTSHGHNTPFWDAPLQGQVLYTLCSGKITYQK